MKYLLSIMLMMFSLSTMASGLNTSGLSEQQVAELNLQVVNMKAQTIKPLVSSADEVEKWASIGQALGGGLAATAKELGVTANEFATTPVGMVAIVIIAWNYMGDSIVGVLFGVFWFSTAIPIWVWFYRALFVTAEIVYYDKGAREDGAIKVKSYRSGDDDISAIHFFYWFTLILIVGIGLLVIF